MPRFELVPLVFFTIFFGVWFTQAYLLLARPKTWVNFFVVRPWKRFGLTVSIADEQRLNRSSRFAGILYLVVGIAVIGLLAIRS